MAPPAQRSGEETRASSVVLGCAVQPHRFWSVSSRSDFNEAVLAPRPPQESPVKGVDSDGLPTVVIGTQELTLAELLRRGLSARGGDHGLAARLLRAFRQMDDMGSGNVTAQGLQEFLSRWCNVRLEPAQAARVVERFDSDGNGTMDYMEFARAVLPSHFGDEALPVLRSGWEQRGETERRLEAAGVPRVTMAGRYVPLTVFVREKLAARSRCSGTASARRAFRRLDADGSGVISRDELGKFLEIYGLYLEEGQLQALMNEFDPIGDGLTVDDFLRNVMPDNFAPEGLEDAGLPGM
jgi:Ca2+-binding EF-hand superfamily protein